MTSLFLFTVLFILLFMGVPIAFSLGLSSILTVLFFTNDSLASMSLKLFDTMEHYTLLAIPFFILASAFLTTGGVARRLIRFAIAAVGHLKGGLAIASVLACMLFAAVSGSSPATVAAIGSIVIGAMVKSGYPLPYAAGMICNAGTLGILIPPSIVMVVYAAATESSVGQLFMAGVIPGLLLGFMLMLAIFFSAHKMNIPTQPKASFRELLIAARDAIWGLGLIFVVMGGIYGGVFTATEAAAVAAVYAFIVALFVHRDMGFREVPHVFAESAKVTVMLLFIITNAFLFAHVLTTERIPQTMAETIVGWGLAPWQFLIVVNVVLLIAGNFMEPSSILLILAPIFFPIATQLGIDPIHLGIIMVVNMEIGMITPPVGLNLFVTSGVTGMPLWDVVKAALPWLMVMLSFLIIVTYVPQVSLFLPQLLF